MDQKNLIHLYNSMFDNAESEEEIKDSANDSHEKLNGLHKKENPELFDCITKIFKYYIHNYNYSFSYDSYENNYIPQKDLDKIEVISNTVFTSSTSLSFFENFNPPNGDFSIIFKYLRNVGYLNEYCFKNCVYMKSIILPNKIIEIKDSCFQNCKNLIKIKLPDHLRSLGSWCFEECKNLKSIVIPNTVTKLNTECFRNCTNLIKVKLPKDLTLLPTGCFENCINLKEINLPNSIFNIARDCFYNCKNLENISLPTSILEIEQTAFKNCKKLQSLTFPESILYLGHSCFSNCTSLEKIVIPKYELIILPYSFSYCINLKEIICDPGFLHLLSDKNYSSILNNKAFHLSKKYKNVFEGVDISKVKITYI